MKPLDITLPPFSDSVDAARDLRDTIDLADAFRNDLAALVEQYRALGKGAAPILDGMAAEVRGKAEDKREHYNATLGGTSVEQMCACGQPWPCLVKHESAKND